MASFTPFEPKGKQRQAHRAAVWAITMHIMDGDKPPTGEEVLARFTPNQKSQMKELLVSGLDVSGNDGRHYHMMLKTYAQVSRGYFRELLDKKNKWWIRPLYIKEGYTFAQSLRFYINYILEKGDPTLQYQCDYTSAPVKKSEQITPRTLLMEKIRRGDRMVDILKEHPGYSSYVLSNMKFSPSRDFRTNITWVWGPPGCGKSTTTHLFLQLLEKIHGIDYWIKGNGWSKWFDGYAQEHICWIDDPSLPNALMRNEENAVDCREGRYAKYLYECAKVTFQLDVSRERTQEFVDDVKPVEEDDDLDKVDY